MLSDEQLAEISHRLDGITNGEAGRYEHAEAINDVANLLAEVRRLREALKGREGLEPLPPMVVLPPGRD